ncbi:MAG: ABC transporter substrate-binding protein [Solirubrobacteraceae bacterium]
MRVNKHTLVGALGAVLAAGCLAACGGGGSPGGGSPGGGSGTGSATASSGGSSGSASPATGNAKPPMNASSPIPGIAGCPKGASGSLHLVGDFGGPYSQEFNPLSASGNTQTFQSFVYEPLLQYSLSKTNSIQPWLASSYKWSAGGKTLSFRLRHGIDWSDGKPFTSADVVYTFQLLKKDPATNLKGIAYSSIAANGPYGVTMHFASPQYTQLFYIGTQYIVPQHVWSKFPNASKAQDTNPIGTGPYRLTKLTTQTIELTANPHYWIKGSPCVKTVNAPTYYSNTTADLAMEQGGGDWGGLFVSGMSRYTRTKGHDFWNPPTNDVALYPNLTKAPLNSLPLRKAISLALDRNKIVQIGELGEEQVIDNATGIILPRDRSQLAPKYANATLTQDTAKAKHLLTAAGYKFGSGGTLMTPSGKPVTLSIMAPAAFSDWIAAVQEVARELGAIGIKATVNPTQNAQWTSDMQLGHYQIAINAGELGPNSFYQYDGWLYSHNTAPIGKLATTNWERYHNAHADSLINSYLATNSPSAQARDMAGLEGVVANQVPVIPLYYATDWGLYTTTKFIGWPSPKDPYQIASSYDNPENEVVLLHLAPKAG